MDNMGLYLWCLGVNLLSFLGLRGSLGQRMKQEGRGKTEPLKE